MLFVQISKEFEIWTKLLQITPCLAKTWEAGALEKKRDWSRFGVVQRCKKQKKPPVKRRLFFFG